ncbi:hypothetical protein [Streptomyces sp. NPDC047453]|uniref:hypothetical protein n=1 Tax=Streptomyces sp. NPDC047453 TaxID=3154812 RepID=UPI0033DDE368
MGREHAHDLVYEAATAARRGGKTLAEALPEVAEAPRPHGHRRRLPRRRRAHRARRSNDLSSQHSARPR